MFSSEFVYYLELESHRLKEVDRMNETRCIHCGKAVTDPVIIMSPDSGWCKECALAVQAQMDETKCMMCGKHQVDAQMRRFGKGAMCDECRKSFKQDMVRMSEEANAKSITKSNVNGPRIAEALNVLLEETKADRIILWQVHGNNLTVTYEVSDERPSCFIGLRLSVDQSTGMLIEYLGRFNAGAIVIENNMTEYLPKLIKFPELSALIKSGEVRSSLVAPVFPQGLPKGFVELQQCSSDRNWIGNEVDALRRTAGELEKLVDV
jgi:hypothetical protein